MLRAAVLALLTVSACAYKPVVFFHGFGFYEANRGTSKEFANATAWLKAAHPGQPAYALAVDDEYYSGKAMWTQLNDFYSALRALVNSKPSEFANGFHVVSHSQGTIVARAVIQSGAWNIDQYVSMAGVHGGYFGSCSTILAQKFTCGIVTELMYTDLLQNQFSVAGYWRAPKYSRYLSGNKFLTYLNNEVSHANSSNYKANLAQVNHITLIASPEDGVITPWYSGHFGFYASDASTQVGLESQVYYGSLGLKDLSTAGKLTLKTVRNAAHNDWLYNQTLLLQHVFPLLS